MKHLLLSTIAAAVLVGCGESQQSAPAPEAKPDEPVAEVPSQPSPPPAEVKPVEPVAEASQPEPQTAKAPDISIHDAAHTGNIEAVKKHLAAGTDVNAKDEDGYTPLYAVAGGGHKEVAELLIAKGADVNAKDKKGWTLLQHAVMMSKREIVGLLITKGADVNAKVAPIDRFFKGKTPLDLASKAEIEDLIRKHGGKTGEELK